MQKFFPDKNKSKFHMKIHHVPSVNEPVLEVGYCRNVHENPVCVSRFDYCDE